MANRTFNEDQLSLIKRLIKGFCFVSVGALGAVTLLKRQFVSTGSALSARSSLITAPTTGVGYAVGDGPNGLVRSITRNSAGNWTLGLLDTYQYLLKAAVASVTNANGLVASGFAVGVVSTSAVQTASGTAQGQGGTLNVVLNNGSGVATDPASGDIVCLELEFGDATEP